MNSRTKTSTRDSDKLVSGNRRRRQKPQLRVVMDTNVLFTGSASDLVQQEVFNLIKQSIFPDLEIQWYLPEVVRHERQFRMQRIAIGLVPAIEKVERLLGHKLAISEETLLESVEKVVSERQQELGLIDLPLDYSKVDWNRLVLDAVYRVPPFEKGGKEKGFRDSLVVESFHQLVVNSPKTPKTCRVVLITGDKLVAQAALTRVLNATNASVFSTLEELKGLINALVSEVDEVFLTDLKAKAEKLFFVPKDESTLFYKEKIRDRLTEKFEKELASIPSGATIRTNRTWQIYSPNFVRKTGSQVQWASRIAINMEASKVVSENYSFSSVAIQNNPEESRYTSVLSPESWAGTTIKLSELTTKSLLSADLSDVPWSPTRSLQTSGETRPTRIVVTHTGVDIYDVLWSTNVTPSRALRRSSIDDIRHVEPAWEEAT